MRTFFLTLTETPSRTEKALAHFNEQGICAEAFIGINADLAGLATTHLYEVDNPGSGFKMGCKPTGIWLSHWMLWAALSLLPDEYFMVLEVDAIFKEGWKEKFDQAWSDTPKDLDFLYIGSCCTGGTLKRLIKGNVYKTDRLQCNHAYVIARKAIPRLINGLRKCWAPLDIQLNFEMFPTMNVYVVLPRLVDQFETIIPD